MAKSTISKVATQLRAKPVLLQGIKLVYSSATRSRISFEPNGKVYSVLYQVPRASLVSLAKFKNNATTKSSLQLIDENDGSTLNLSVQDSQSRTQTDLFYNQFMRIAMCDNLPVYFLRHCEELFE